MGKKKIFLCEKIKQFSVLWVMDEHTLGQFLKKRNKVTQMNIKLSNRKKDNLIS